MNAPPNILNDLSISKHQCQYFPHGKVHERATFRHIVIKNYYRHSELVVATLRVPSTHRPTLQAEPATLDKFESTFLLLDVPVLKRSRTGRNYENIAAVRVSVQNELNQPLSRRSQDLGISQTTLKRNFRKDLSLHPYKITLTQELKPLDHLKCRNFFDWTLVKLHKVQNLICFGRHPQQNYRVVWVSCRRCYCAVFFRRHVTVNDEHYPAMLEDYLYPELNELDIYVVCLVVP